MALPKPVLYSGDFANSPMRRKPKNVSIATWALWIWSVWTCVYGVLDALHQIPEFESMLADQAQGLLSITPEQITEWVYGIYSAIAIASAWIIWKIGAGRRWARSSLMWGFVCQIGVAFLPPYTDWRGHLANIPDLGLQIYALYLLYTAPGKSWFAETKAKK